MKSFITACALVAAMSGAKKSRPSIVYVNASGSRDRFNDHNYDYGHGGQGPNYGSSYDSAPGLWYGEDGEVHHDNNYGNAPYHGDSYYNDSYDNAPYYGDSYDNGPYYGNDYSDYNNTPYSDSYHNDRYGDYYPRNSYGGISDSYNGNSYSGHSDSYGDYRLNHGPRGHKYTHQAPIGNRAYRHAGPAKNYGAWNKSYNLSVETFEKTVVTDEENVWVVAFIDPACGYCKKLVVEWEKLRTEETIKSRKVKFGYVDITVEESYEIVNKYTAGRSVQATPSVFVYGREKLAPSVYSGDFSFNSLGDYIVGECDSQGYGLHQVGHGHDAEGCNIDAHYKYPNHNGHGHGDGYGSGYGSHDNRNRSGYGGYGNGYGNNKGDYGNGYGNRYGHGGYGNGYDSFDNNGYVNGNIIADTYSNKKNGYGDSGYNSYGNNYGIGYGPGQGPIKIASTYASNKKSVKGNSNYKKST